MHLSSGELCDTDQGATAVPEGASRTIQLIDPARAGYLGRIQMPPPQTILDVPGAHSQSAMIRSIVQNRVNKSRNAATLTNLEFETAGPRRAKTPALKTRLRVNKVRT